MRNSVLAEGGTDVRKRIRQIARGQFGNEAPVLLLPEEELSITVTEGQEYTGDFEIISTNNVTVRGIVYSTNARMECLLSQFEGEEVHIRFQFHSKGLEEGAVEKGDFVIVCNQKVYSLSFCVSVSRLYADSSRGPICSLYDFTCLAKENWNEAYRLFYHHSFPNIIKPKEVKEAMLYRGILDAKPSQQNMEEFLIGIRKKKRISFFLDQTINRLAAVTETMQQSLEIKKDEWGYLALTITVDADFIRLSENKVTTEDFLGSTYVCKYLVDYDRMHAGYNFGRIMVSSVYETKILEISAHKGKKMRDSKMSERVQMKESRAGLVELYQAYRLKKIVTGVWANETVEILNHLHAMDEEEPLYVLMKAQALIINRQRQEAEWILDEFKRNWEDHQAPVWGYYLYIMTLMEREPSYVDRMTHEIELIFHENPDSVFLFWILSFLKEEYYNNSEYKFKSIENWVMQGCSSPYLYIEAYYLLWQDPYLLTRLGKFEIRILRWAVRCHSLTRELASRIFEIVKPNAGFDPVHFMLLEAAYEVYPTPEKVGMVCSYLIRSQKFDVKFHRWFEMGIELELRITSLYEAYLLSLDERAIGPVPKIIQMYFQYNSKLPYRKMAILYNNLIASKETEPELYRQYSRTMGRFAMEQLELEHMDDNLAVIYEDMLELGLVNEELAHHLAKILFTHKLVLFDKRMVRAIIYQRQFLEPQIVPIVDRAAYFQLYSDEYVILFEDEKGRRYVSSISYRLEKLMDPGKYIETCMELAPEELSYIISYFGKKQNYLTYSVEDEKFFRRILFARELNTLYQTDTALEILRYYQTKDFAPVVKEYLQRVDFDILPSAARQYMLELLVDYHMYDKAYDILQVYGLDQVGAASKATLAGYMIDCYAGEEEKDEFLLLLCADSFFHKKYNDKILRYLCDFYDGPSEYMLRLWRAAKEFETSTFELKERILVQMMYADMDLVNQADLFLDYYKEGGRELVVLAYISACAHAYFVGGQTISTEILSIIRSRYLRHMELNDACKLALLKSLAEGDEEDEKRFELEDELLAEYTRRNMNFAFFKKMDKRLVLKYHLYDKVFLEYRTNPKNHVVLHYSRDEDGENFRSMDMKDIYDGIFVTEFVLFFGEVVQYYITEEFGNQVEVKESSRLTSNDVYSKKDESRYNLINQMLMSETLLDSQSLYHHMGLYAGFDEVTSKVFKLL